MMPIISTKMLLCGAAVAALVGGVIGGWASTTDPPLQNASAGFAETNGLGTDYGCPDPCAGGGAGTTVVNSTICHVTVTHSSAQGAFCAWNFGSTNVNDQSFSTPANGGAGGDTTTTIINTTTTNTDSNNNNSFNTVTTTTTTTTITNVNNTFINQTIVSDSNTASGDNSTVVDDSNVTTTTTTTTNTGTEQNTQTCEADENEGLLGLQVNVQVCNNSVDVIDDSEEVGVLPAEVEPEVGLPV